MVCCIISEVCSLPSFDHGQVRSNGTDLVKSGEQATITCASNYAPLYTITTCQTDRSWSPLPSCANVTCTVPALLNGQYYLNQDTVSIGTILEYPSLITPVCFPGFLPSPDTQRTCQSNELWSGPAPICASFSCNSLPVAFQNGSYDVRGSGPPYVYNDSVYPKCDEGFYLDQGGERRCSGMNVWSGKPPVCLPITCRPPSVFSNGNYNGSHASYSLGTVLIPTCEVGYYLTNTVQSRTCEGQNTWSGASPSCQIVTCTTPSELKHGTFNADNQTYAYQTVITVACYEGYEVENGISSSTCREDGTWSSVLQCIPVICNDSRGVEHEAIPSYPFPAFGESVFVVYNSTFFTIKNGSLQVYCSNGRRLAWIDKPYFGESTCLTSKNT